MIKGLDGTTLWMYLDGTHQDGHCPPLLKQKNILFWIVPLLKERFHSHILTHQWNQGWLTAFGYQEDTKESQSLSSMQRNVLLIFLLRLVLTDTGIRKNELLINKYSIMIGV